MSNFKFFTDEQKISFMFRKLKVGSIYMLPSFGFTAYSSPNGASEYIDTNPFTKSLDSQPVELIEMDGSYCKVKFIESRKGKRPEFWIRASDVAYRGIIGGLIFAAIASVPYMAYNMFVWIKKKCGGSGE